MALVTGASRGIGAAIAEELAAAGATVILNYNGSLERAEAVQKGIEDKGGQSFLMKCDVADFDSCKNMMDTILKEHGKLDILVNNAGITRDGLLMAMTEEDFDRVIDTNLKGAFHTMHFAARPMLRAKSGKIINISSASGIMGNPGQVNYSASKAGIIGMTKSAAKELASRGICVNAVAPGFIETEMTEALPEKTRDNACETIPMGHFGSVRDIAKAVLFLAGPDSDYITGQVLSVNGGLC